MAWKLKPPKVHAKRLFNQRAERKPEIREKRKTINVVNVQSVLTQACVCKAEGVLAVNQNYRRVIQEQVDLAKTLSS